jgi:hypothetical protein
MTIEINGMAHVILTVSRFDLARAFYGKLLPEFGMKPVYDGDGLFYCVGARTAIGMSPVIRLWLANASCNSVSACTTFVCVPGLARTWIDALLCSRRWRRRSFAVPWTVHGHLATTTCCSRTQTGSG